jgi:hypothetical protein
VREIFNTSSESDDCPNWQSPPTGGYDVADVVEFLPPGEQNEIVFGESLEAVWSEELPVETSDQPPEASTDYETRLETVVLHTSLQKDRHRGADYRRIDGVTYDGNTLWLPKATPELTRPESFDVPSKLAGIIPVYFQQSYIDNPGRHVNCHRWGAVYDRVPDLSSDDTFALADRTVRYGQQVSPENLMVGERADIGLPSGDDSAGMSFHTFVVIAPGLAIQTDNANAPFSLEPVDQVLDYYRQTLPGVRLFVLRPEQGPPDAR